MPREVHEDTDLYTIEYDDELGAVVHTWTDFASGREYREGCERLLEVVQQERATKLLVDTSGIQAHDDEDLQWLREEWAPRTIEAGVEYYATVHPDSVISEMDIEKLMEGAADIPQEPFITSDMAEAREWLAER
jgi:hypothetical protein